MNEEKTNNLISKEKIEIGKDEIKSNNQIIEQTEISDLQKQNQQINQQEQVGSNKVQFDQIAKFCQIYIILYFSLIGLFLLGIIFSWFSIVWALGIVFIVLACIATVVCIGLSVILFLRTFDLKTFPQLSKWWEELKKASKSNKLTEFLQNHFDSSAYLFAIGIVFNLCSIVAAFIVLSIIKKRNLNVKP